MADPVLEEARLTYSDYLMNNGELRGSGANGASQLGRPRSALLVTTNTSYTVRLGRTDSA